MADNKGAGVIIAIIILVVALFALNQAGIIGAPKEKVVTPPSAVAPGVQQVAQVTPSGEAMNPYITEIDVLVDTKDPVAFASDQTTYRPNVTLRYFREGSSQYTETSHIGGTVQTITVNPGESIRMIWYGAGTEKVYMGEKTIVTPKDKKQMIVELPAQVVGSVALDAKWNNVAGATQYTIAAGQKDTTKLKLVINSDVGKKTFLGPKVVIAFDKDAFNDILLGTSVGGTFKEFTTSAVSDRLVAPVAANGEYYRKMYDTGISALNDFGVADDISVQLDAKSTAAWSGATENVTFTVVDTAGYLGKDGSTIYYDAETAKLDAHIDVPASAADVSLLMTNTN